eukprot:scaffold6427_cov202-Skeletonema_marinoi.AAC.4
MQSHSLSGVSLLLYLEEDRQDMYEHFPHPILLSLVLSHVHWYSEESFQRPHSNLMLSTGPVEY